MLLKRTNLFNKNRPIYHGGQTSLMKTLLIQYRLNPALWKTTLAIDDESEGRVVLNTRNGPYYRAGRVTVLQRTLFRAYDGKASDKLLAVPPVSSPRVRCYERRSPCA